MPKRKYDVQLRYSHHREYRGGHAKGVARDLEQQALERAELLNRMREKNAPEVEDNPLVALFFHLAGVALATVGWILALKLIGVL